MLEQLFHPLAPVEHVSMLASTHVMAAQLQSEVSILQTIVALLQLKIPHALGEHVLHLPHLQESRSTPIVMTPLDVLEESIFHHTQLMDKMDNR